MILTPAPEHARLVKAAIAAGKDVYCEWPLTTKTPDSEELLSLAEAKGVRHIVGLQRPLGPGVRYMRDLVKQVRMTRGMILAPINGNCELKDIFGRAFQHVTKHSIVEKEKLQILPASILRTMLISEIQQFINLLELRSPLEELVETRDYIKGMIAILAKKEDMEIDHMMGNYFPADDQNNSRIGFQL